MCDFNLFRFKSEDCWSAFLRNYDDTTGPVSNLSAVTHEDDFHRQIEAAPT